MADKNFMIQKIKSLVKSSADSAEDLVKHPKLSSEDFIANNRAVSVSIGNINNDEEDGDDQRGSLDQYDYNSEEYYRGSNTTNSLKNILLPGEWLELELGYLSIPPALETKDMKAFLNQLNDLHSHPVRPMHK
jgi:hypothetical protein